MSGPGVFRAAAAQPLRDHWAAVALALVLLPGCGAGQAPPVYEDEQGFRLVPPPGWSERARPALAPARQVANPGAAAQGRRKGQVDLPLPPLGVPGGAGPERLMVRYDRLTAGRQAWLRVSAADLPPSVSLEACLSARAPTGGWQRASKVEGMEVSGLPAARVAFRGRWDNQDYLNETVAVRKGERAYFITASFPAADSTAREQVRQAVANATWR